MAQPQLPEISFDIWALITDILGDEMKRSRRSEALKALSLTCKALVPLCRKHLFMKLCLICYGNNAHLSRLNSFISTSPEIVQYVQHLDYYIKPPEDDCFNEILDAMREHSTILQYIRIHASTAWDTYPTSTQNLLEQLIRLPTVVHLSLSGLTGVPPHIPGSCANLPHLTLQRVGFIQTDDPGSLELLRTSPASRNGGLKKMTLQCSIEDLQAFWDLLQMTSTLEDLDLLILEPYEFEGLAPVLSSHVISTLKYLSLSTCSSGDDDDDAPLCGLVPELAKISGTNILEKISVYIDFFGDAPEWRQDREDWGALDSLLTTPGSFPKLKSVSMKISWETTIGVNTEQEVLDRITENHFPTLLKHETIKFSLLIDSRFYDA